MAKLDEAREGLAKMMNCDAGEVAITGNTTDGANLKQNFANYGGQLRRPITAKFWRPIILTKNTQLRPFELIFWRMAAGLNIACALLDTDAIALEDEFSSAPLAWMQAKKNVSC